MARLRMFLFLIVWPILLLSPVKASEQAWLALSEGAIVLFRHALAPGTGDPSGFRLDDCRTQRNLNDDGRSDAVAIGAAFREYNIAVGAVLTSQWCRCRETAELAFPGKVTDAPAFNSFFADRSSGPNQTEEARRLLSNWSGRGALIVVTHQVNITALTGAFARSGEGIVIRVNEGRIDIIGRLALSGQS